MTVGIVVTGKVWKFGDHINTDYMAPSSIEQTAWEEAKKHILIVHETFAKNCQPGDSIVAGRNFGCGSSRESAPKNLKQLGIGCIVAESFGRIFFRNCIAIALPVLICKGITGVFEEGDQLRLDLENAQVENISTGRVIKGLPLSPEILEIIKAGGIFSTSTESNGISKHEHFC